MGAMKRKAEQSSGSGHKWIRGNKIGEGGFGSLFAAFSKRRYIHIDHMPEAMAVRSAKMRDSESIQYELQVYRDLNHGGRCPFIIDHYGEEIYNLALEVAWASLARLIKVVGSDCRNPMCGGTIPVTFLKGLDTSTSVVMSTVT